jgi:hypothetical protein
MNRRKRKNTDQTVTAGATDQDLDPEGTPKLGVITGTGKCSRIIQDDKAKKKRHRIAYI